MDSIEETNLSAVIISAFYQGKNSGGSLELMLSDIESSWHQKVQKPATMHRGTSQSCARRTRHGWVPLRKKNAGKSVRRLS